MNRPAGAKVSDGVYHPATDNVRGDFASVSHNDQVQLFQNLVHKVALVDKPDRECAKHYQKRVGMSKAEYFKKYGATGELICPYEGRPGAYITGSGNFTCANDVLTVPLHAFVNFEIGKIIARPSKCKIVLIGSNGEKMKPIRLTNDMIGGVDIFAKNLTDKKRKVLLLNSEADWAVVKTETKSPEVTPYTVFDRNPIVETNVENPQLISVSAPQVDMDCPAISVGCPILNTYAPSDIPQSWPRGVLTACDTNHGASGGANLQKIDGKMALVGMNADSDDPNGPNGKIVWFKDTSKNKYQPLHNDSRTVLVERAFQKAIGKMCGSENLAHLPSSPYDAKSYSEPITVGSKN